MAEFRCKRCPGLDGGISIPAILILSVLLCTTGCITKFRTGVPLQADQQPIVAADLAVAGVLARRPGDSGTKLPETAARFAKLSGAEDRSSTLSERDLVTLLSSPSEMRNSTQALQSLGARIGHRYVLVGEASTAPTDELKSWIIQIVVPIPFIWISFGIPVQYASNPDQPHATVSARVVDLNRGEILAASFEVGSDIDSNETPAFQNSAASRAVKRMDIGRR